MMDIMNDYRVDINELNAPDSPSMEELGIETFRTSPPASNLAMAVNCV